MNNVLDPNSTNTTRPRHQGVVSASLDQKTPLHPRALWPAVTVDAWSEDVAIVLGSKITEAASKPKDRHGIYFLDLPMEIRYQIYKWMLLANPIDGSKLYPWYPSPSYRAYFLQVVTRGQDNPMPTVLESIHPSGREGADVEDRLTHRQPRRRPLSPYRPVGFIPSALLQASWQLYEEAHLIPFHQNEFVFVNRFSSGLTAAKMFIARMEPWQRDNVRYARLEIQIKDIGLEERLEDWEELCRLWSAGLRGLRLKIELEEQTLRAASGHDVWSRPGIDFPGCEPSSLPRGWSCAPFRWVDRGLRKLQVLRALEVELVGFPLDNNQRLAWTETLSERLNDERPPRDFTGVSCVQRSWRKIS